MLVQIEADRFMAAVCSIYFFDSVQGFDDRCVGNRSGVVNFF